MCLWVCVVCVLLVRGCNGVCDGCVCVCWRVCADVCLLVCVCDHEAVLFVALCVVVFCGVCIV